MKNQALRSLIKDAILIIVLGGIASIMISVDGTLSPGLATFIWLAITGIPFGWRWAKNMFTAVSVKGFFIKLLFASLLGCIAIFVIVLKDIFSFIKSLKKTPVE